MATNAGLRRYAVSYDPEELEVGYREMANDLEREREADEWSEGLIGDASAHG